MPCRRPSTLRASDKCFAWHRERYSKIGRISGAAQAHVIRLERAVLPGAQRGYLILEAAAPRITVFEAQRVPGLLQTPAYARALAEADPFLPDERGARPSGRGASVPPAGGTRRAAPGGLPGDRGGGTAPGSRQPGSDGEQLAVLAEVAADSGRLTFQVLEFDYGAHTRRGRER